MTDLVESIKKEDVNEMAYDVTGNVYEETATV